jgi:hypothetical protein
MATLQATTIPALTATSVTSPLTYDSGTYAMLEWAGSTSLANNASADIICNTSGYARMIGTCYFMAVRSSTSWSFGMFSFSVSLYGVLSSTQLQSDWGSFSLSHYNESYNNNWLRFTNDSGDSGTFYFNVLLENAVGSNSNILTRIK